MSDAPAPPADSFADPSADWAASLRADNRSRFEGWEPSAPHRRHVTRQLALGFDPADRPRLALLGFGPGLDADLPTLLTTFAEIAVADIDGETVREALDRQGVAGDDRVKTAFGGDLLPTAGGPHAGEHAADYADGLSAGRPVPGVGGGFDAAGSVAVLTQLIDRVVDRVGPDDPRLPDFAAAVRVGHLRTLAGLLKPGGVGLLVTDLFSAVTCPALKTADSADVPALIEAELAKENVFVGVHPVLLMHSARGEIGGVRVAKTQLLKPWRWDTANRSYAMTGVKFRLAGPDAGNPGTENAPAA